jgi:hypothetical protein
MVHGFYAAMGGYVIRSHSLDKTYPITGQGRMTLTKSGVLYLLQVAPEVFPDLSEDEILDKSKASTFIKTLTCLQGLWFCLQCIVRLTMNTSISLLELNVFGHCICTFVVYAIWWNKPMDVSGSTFIKAEESSEFQGLIALLCSYTSRTVPRLPPPLAEYAFCGYEHRLRIDVSSNTADDNISLDWQRSAWTFIYYLSGHMPHSRTVIDQDPGRRRWRTLLNDNKEPKYFDNLNTKFGMKGSPVHDARYYHRDGCHPGITGSEVRIYECAGLRIEQLEQLLGLDGSDPQM